MPPATMPERADRDRGSIAVSPATAGEWVREAARAGGARLVDAVAADALVWGGGPAGELAAVLAERTAIRWVQLPSAGIERYASLVGDGREWTCAKGIYAQPVAEHALALTLAGLHRLPELTRRRSWGTIRYRDLYEGEVTLVGGGGIAEWFLRLVAPFRTRVTVVRRHPRAMLGAAEVVGSEGLQDALRTADVVVLAAALTRETEGLIGAPEFDVMRPEAWLVNVGRGRLVRTDDLVGALRAGAIGGAALDVTDPEPLPDGHPLWELDNCLITPHCANPPEIEHARYAELVTENVRRWIAGEPLRGRVDPALGY